MDIPLEIKIKLFNRIEEEVYNILEKNKQNLRISRISSKHYDAPTNALSRAKRTIITLAIASIKTSVIFFVDILINMNWDQESYKLSQQISATSPVTYSIHISKSFIRFLDLFNENLPSQFKKESDKRYENNRTWNITEEDAFLVYMNDTDFLTNII